MADHRPETMQPLSLAFVGDAVYSVYVRTHLLIEKPYLKPDAIHREANRLVNAGAQAEALDHLRKNVLTEDEWDIARKARNKSSATRAKNASIKDYRNASGLEALVGHLHISGNRNRIDELMEIILETGRDNDE
ncbi:ribonuclease III domain-containing protein [Salinicoccus sp. ID82-1]|uniref:Mini-ribonuclease 3 n=1 Tax=Salinicoccus sp. ID82-1 TaxID=2820269 RepID=UPI001F367BDA